MKFTGKNGVLRIFDGSKNLHGAAPRDDATADIVTFDGATTWANITSDVDTYDAAAASAFLADTDGLVFIGSDIPFSIVKYLKGAGSNYAAASGALKAFYFDGTNFAESLAGVVDGTASGGDCFAADGHISFKAPSGWAIGANAYNANLDADKYYIALQTTTSPSTDPDADVLCPVDGQYFEVSFASMDFNGPLGRPSTEEMLVLDRGNMSSKAHYIEGVDGKIYESVPVSFSALLDDVYNRERLQAALECGNPDDSGRWTTTGTTTKGTTKNDGTNYNPAFADASKKTVNIHWLMESTRTAGLDQGMAYYETYFPYDEITFAEAEDGVTLSAAGGCFGKIERINHLCNRYETDVAIVGVSWDESADTYVRTGDIDLTIQKLMKRCILNDDGTVNYYLDPNDSTLKEDGVTASVLDGTDGQVMVEIPKFYYRYSYAGTVHTWDISRTQLSGFSLHPAFSKGGTVLDHKYVGAYEAYKDGSGVLSSESGLTPTVDATRAEFRGYAAARGAGWHQLDFYSASMIHLLYLIEYADLNSQAMIGEGNTKYAAWPGSLPSVTGLSNGNGNGTDNKSTVGGDAGDYMVYRGIENIYGHIYKWVDGFNINNNVPYVCQDPDDFADDTVAGYTDLGVTLAVADGYGNTLAAISAGFLSVSIGAGSGTKLCDYYYQAAGWRVAHLGGKANNGLAAGAFDWNLNNGSSNSDSVIGGRLCF